MKSIGSEVLSISSSLPCSETSKGIGFLNRNGNFCKKPQVGKLLRELKSAPMCVIKKVHWFLSYVCNRKFAAFGCFAAG